MATMTFRASQPPALQTRGAAMTAQILNLADHTNQDRRHQLLSNLAFVRREINRMRQQGHSTELIEGCGMFAATKSLKERLLALPIQPNDQSPEQMLVDRLKAAYALRESDPAGFAAAIIIWEADLQVLFSYQAGEEYGY
jgi:hypothetical protein